MKKRITEYLNRIDAILREAPDGYDYAALLNEHLVQIGFFQHERLIHLLVTLTFAILTVASVLTIVITGYLPLAALAALLLVLLIPYVAHYYLLENGVQKMYAQYDLILKKTMEK